MHRQPNAICDGFLTEAYNEFKAADSEIGIGYQIFFHIVLFVSVTLVFALFYMKTQYLCHRHRVKIHSSFYN